MKPRLVFVHGVGGARDPAAELERWLEALAVGATAAGHTTRARELLAGATADVSFAYYADLFANPQAQGGHDTEEDYVLDVRDLLREAIEARLSEGADNGDDVTALDRARARLDPGETAQGSGSVVRQLLNVANSLFGVRGLRRFGGWASSRLLVGQLSQVTRYLGRAEADGTGLTLDTRVRSRVTEALDPAVPTVVVAHSLGSVVALEALASYRGDIPLFLTLGSPLGLRAVVAQRVVPHPVQVPDPVSGWVNIWDRDDLIVGRPLLERFVRPNARSVLPSSRRVDSDGAWVHPVLKYLAHPGVAGPVMQAVEVAARS
ncbi:alpha/beta hydrolase [Streptomyces sp. NPDC048279]|uniref:alpha/beta hydrolase n=1 Tax=Streptomyces sp. NPDC048279 TaxID=3154714 RepID=UPI003449AA7C